MIHGGEFRTIGDICFLKQFKEPLDPVTLRERAEVRGNFASGELGTEAIRQSRPDD